MTLNRVAGSRRPAEPNMVVDYADVLRQAVENERWRVLREVRRAVESVKATQPSSSRGYGDDARKGSEVKRDVLAALDRIETAPDPRMT